MSPQIEVSSVSMYMVSSFNKCLLGPLMSKFWAMGSGYKDEYNRVCLLEERSLTGKICHLGQCGRCYDREVCVMLKGLRVGSQNF